MVAPLINISAPILETFKLTKEQRDNITSHHNGIVGHMGVQSTLQRLLDFGLNWLHMRQRVKNFVKNCPVCQKLSAVKFPNYSHPFTTSTYVPMQCLNIDFIGPFS